MIVVWKLDRLGRSLTHLVNTVQDLSTRGVGLRVLTGQGAQIDTTTAAGRGAGRVRAELIRERTLAGLTAARARGRHGGGKFALSKTQVRLAQVALESTPSLAGHCAPGHRATPAQGDGLPAPAQAS